MERCAVTTEVSAEGQMKMKITNRGGMTTNVIIKVRLHCHGCPCQGRVTGSCPMEWQGNPVGGYPVFPKPTMHTL